MQLEFVKCGLQFFPFIPLLESINDLLWPALSGSSNQIQIFCKNCVRLFIYQVWLLPPGDISVHTDMQDSTQKQERMDET